jgi:hypothetical protein
MIGRPRTPAETKRLHTFIGVAAVLWLGAAIAAVIDGDPLHERVRDRLRSADPNTPMAATARDSREAGQ